MSLEIKSINYHSLNDLVKPFGETITEYHPQIVSDCLEYGIDEIISDEDFKEMPIVKHLQQTIRVFKSIRDDFFEVKCFQFITQLKSSVLDSEMEKFKEDIRNDEVLKNKVLTFLLILIDKFEDLNKSRILGELFSSYINGKISWEEFETLSYFINSAHPDSFKLLYDYIEYKKLDFRGLGDVIHILNYSGLGHLNAQGFNLTTYGNKIYEFALEAVYEKESFTLNYESCPVFWEKLKADDREDIGKYFLPNNHEITLILGLKHIIDVYDKTGNYKDKSIKLRKEIYDDFVKWSET
jgi:hypothetical protein